MPDKKMIKTRREVLQKAIKGVGLLGLGGGIWGTTALKIKASDRALRPPGSLEEKNFVKACIRCGTCVESCPYDTLKLATLGDPIAIGTPYFQPRSIPCYMCPEVPCVQVCPSGALDVEIIAKPDENGKTVGPDIKKARMGVAVVDEESCLAYWGIQCDACYRACPLMGEAITIEFRRNDRTGKHAILEPLVHKEACTGCGLCENACITEKAAIFILPREIAMGKVGAHYIREWESNDEERLRTPEELDTKEKTPEDILNDWEYLLEDD